MDVDSDSSCTSSTCSEDSLCDELAQLVTQCEALHLHHHTALDTLYRIHRLLEEQNGIAVHYQCEDRDFGDVLEDLHASALEEIDQGGSVHFGETLLGALHYLSPSHDLKN